jgi:Na+-driven multidrug efflux pump
MYSLLSVQTAHIGTLMSCSTLIINVCLNYVLIFGHFGFRAMGVRGAAIATLTSRCVELIIVVFYLLAVDKKLKFKLSELLRFELSYLRDFVKVSLPVVLAGSQWGIAQAVQTAILGHVSATAIAANAIAGVVFQVFAVLCWGAASAAQVTVGKTVGGGNLEQIKSYSNLLQMIFIIIGIVTGVGLFLCKGLIVGTYSVSAETHALSIAFLTVLSVSAFGTSYEFPVEAGIIAGGGDTAYQSIVDTAFMWLFTIPAAAISAFVFHWPPIVTFAFLKADQLLKCIPNAIYVNKYRHRWVRVLTR